MKEHDRLDFLAVGLVAGDRMTAKTRAIWRKEFHREIASRGGVEGDHYVRSIANELLRKVVQRGLRRFRNDLVGRLAEEMTEDDAERLDDVMSNMLAEALAEIKD